MYLNTKVSRTTLLSLWVHSARYAVLGSQKNPPVSLEEAFVPAAWWPLYLYRAFAALAAIICCAQVCSPTLSTSWGISLCTAWGFCLIPLSVKVCCHVLAGRLQNSFLNMRCVCLLCCFVPPHWILIQEVAVHRSGNAESVWFSHLFKFEMLGSCKGKNRFLNLKPQAGWYSRMMGLSCGSPHKTH